MKTFTRAEVARHCTPEDGWVIYHGVVYDLSGVIDQHPGPTACITCRLGSDMTQILDQKHAGLPITRIIAGLAIGHVAD